MGKRILPDFFLEEVLGAEGLHACLYLLAVDMEMEPLPGYAYASWDTGYGDFRMIPDITTLRLCPWLEKTAMVICDIADEETERADAGRAPADPEEPDRRRGRDGLPGEDRLRARVLPVQGLVRCAGRARLPRGPSELELHHGLPHAADHQGRVVHPAGAQRYAGRRHPGGVQQGRVRQRPARDQHHVLRRAVERRQPRAVQARRQRDRRAQRRGGHVHGQMDDGGGRLELPPALQRVERRRDEQSDVGRRRRPAHVGYLPLVSRRPHGHRPGDVVDVRPVRELLQALPARVVGTDRDRVGARQPHGGLPHGRRTQGRPSRMSAPRSRRQSVPRVRRDHRERHVGHPQPGGASRDVLGKRLRGQGRAARADQPP